MQWTSSARLRVVLFFWTVEQPQSVTVPVYYVQHAAQHCDTMRCRQVLVWFAIWTVNCTASPYDPHVPDHDPWFEGWYTRVLATDSDLTFGILTGYFPDQALKEPSNFAGILFASSRTNNTRAYQHVPLNTTVTDSDGSPIHKQPAKLGDPHFAVHTADKSCNFTANGTAFEASVAAEGAKMTVRGHADGMPWGPDGETPEGITACADDCHCP